MVVNDLDVFRPCGGPPEANPPLIVDADTVLSGTVTRKSFHAALVTEPFTGSSGYPRCADRFNSWTETR